MDENTEEIILEKLISIETRIKEANLLKKEFLNVKEASYYISTSASNLYSLTSHNEIPFYKPNGKRVYFRREELDQWIFDHKSVSIEETENKVSDFLASYKDE